MFTVSLSTASGKTVTVDYATANNTATAGADYTANSGQLTFAPGQTNQTISVAVNGDRTDELDETFFVNIRYAINATIADALDSTLFQWQKANLMAFYKGNIFVKCF